MKNAVKHPEAEPAKWTGPVVLQLCVWSFLLGANLVRWIGAFNAREPWLGAGLGCAVSAGGLALVLGGARRRARARNRRDVAGGS